MHVIRHNTWTGITLQYAYSIGVISIVMEICITYYITHCHVNFHCQVDTTGLPLKRFMSVVYTKKSRSVPYSVSYTTNMQGKPGGRWKSLRKSVIENCYRWITAYTTSPFYHSNVENITYHCSSTLNITSAG